MSARLTPLEPLRQDVAYAWRSLRRSPGFAAVAVLVLALGIGLSTAMFTVFNAVLLRRLPVRAQDSVVVMWGEHRARGFPHVPLPLRAGREFGQGSRTLEGAALVDYNGAWPVIVRDGERTLRIKQGLVSGNFFQVLGVRPVIGRTLLPEDDVRGAAPVMVISQALWRSVFAGDPAVLGRRLRMHMSGRTYTVVGVMPAGLEYPAGTEAWLPIFPASLAPGADTSVALVDVVGRLRPGASEARAGAELAAFFARREGSTLWREVSPVTNTLPELVIGDVGPVLAILSAAVGLLLLVACINVANLLLIRGTRRAREVAIRAALGAGRPRLVRQLLTESVVLAAAGGAAGVAIAYAALRALVAAAPPGLPRLGEVHLDAAAVAAAVAISLLAVLLFGAGPALWTVRAEAGAVLRGGARGTTGGRGAQLARGALVVWQVALTVLVLAGAGVVGRSLLRLQRLDMGFAGERLLIAELSWPLEMLTEKGRVLAMWDELLPRIERIPGVQAAAQVTVPPFSGTGGWDGMFVGEGQSEEAQRTNPVLNMELTSPAYFRTFGVAVTRGRPFTEQDRPGTVPVVVLSEGAARAFWPGQDPIGKRLRFAIPGDPWLTVVGVVEDTRYRELRTPRPTIYLPSRQLPFPYAPTMLAVRTSGDPAAVLPAVRRVIREADPDVLVSSGSTMGQLLAGPLAQPRFNALLLAVFAVSALGLAAVGLYGVLAFAVRQRTRELGVRMALGAAPADVRRLVLRQGLALAALGAALGVAASLAGTRALAALLFEVSPVDPPSLAAVTGVLLLAALAACWIPARAATRVDPMVALRAE